LTLVGMRSNSRQFEPPTERQAGSTPTARSGGGDRPQGDPEGVRRAAPNNPSRGANKNELKQSLMTVRHRSQELFKWQSLRPNNNKR
jgi:hypothetical protein